MGDFRITINVLSDQNILDKTSGKTLDRLFMFLKEYKNLKWLQEEKEKLDKSVSVSKIKDWIYFFYDILNVDGGSLNPPHELKSDGIYCDLPITINLSEGEYALHNIALVYTNADFTIQGIENKSVIKLYRFKFEEGTDDAYKNYWNEMIFFKGPVKRVEQQDSENGNTLTLKNLTFRLQDGIWFPYKYKDIYDGSDQEHQLGIVMKYTFFPKVVISKIDIEANNNGEFTLLEGEECSHQTVTDCRFYLNNWFDHTKIDPITGKEWAKVREVGANFNLLGSNKSVLVARNTFIKHGNDEALTFFTRKVNEQDSEVQTSLHENIRVVDNTFTYIDTPLHDGEVHLNGVLITFNPYEGVKSVWKNLLFAGNTVNLEGPVGTAVSMTVIPGDLCHDVRFVGNHLNHTYHYNGKLPGNSTEAGIIKYGAPSSYLYSTSFTFRKSENTDGMRMSEMGDHPSAGHDASTVTEDVIEPTPVVFRDNHIYYAQHVRDSVDKNGFAYAAEHSCFAVYGGDVDIVGNTIDGTQAMVLRHMNTNGTNSDGTYGNTDNPVSLFHCFPLDTPKLSVESSHHTNIRGNRAAGYGVALRCRHQYASQRIIKGYIIRMKNNSLSDGAAIVLYNVSDSDIAIIRNEFTGCPAAPVVYYEQHSDNLTGIPPTDLKIFQNKLEATGENTKGSMFKIIKSIVPLNKFCFTLNYLPGFSSMSVAANAATDMNVSDNLYVPKSGNGCGC